MYAFIKGKIEHKELGLLEIDVNGVGYEVCVTDKVFSDCREGEDIVLYTAFIVKEDANTLYGFAVSYTHLDVYKRQRGYSPLMSALAFSMWTMAISSVTFSPTLKA